MQPYLHSYLLAALVIPLFHAPYLGNAPASVDPTIPTGNYTPEREDEVRAQFNSMQGDLKQCGYTYIRDYQKSLYEYCTSTDGGKGIGGGCDHVAYAWSIHTRILELAFEHCSTASPTR